MAHWPHAAPLLVLACGSRSADAPKIDIGQLGPMTIQERLKPVSRGGHPRGHAQVLFHDAGCEDEHLSE